jgi:hypothetical protein
MQNANSILVTKNTKEGFEYSIRVEYHTRIFTKDIKNDEELISAIRDNLYVDNDTYENK